MSESLSAQSGAGSTREIYVQLSLEALSLRALGISWDVLSRAFSLSPTVIRCMVGDAFAMCSDARVNPRDEDYPFEVDLVGKDKLKALLDTGDFPVSDFAVTPQWAPTTDVISITEGLEAFLKGGVDTSRIHMRMQNTVEIHDWINEIKLSFISRDLRRELFVLLPLPIVDERKWTFLRPQRPLSGQEDALRLIASLSALGLGYQDSGHRTEFFSDLVWTSQLLFDHIGVGGATSQNLPTDDLLCKQLNGLAKNILLIRQDANGRSRNPASQAFVLDFASAWEDNPNRFGDKSMHDRSKSVDDMTDALLVHMVRSSGICLQLPLKPRLLTKKPSEHDVQVLAPKPWLESLKQGDGANRGVVDTNGTLYYIDAPLRLKEVRRNLKKLKD
jgi:hypothetical protein